MIFVFEDYELDTERYELRRAGAPCPLEPQGFNVLAYLVQHHDRVVTKQELLDHLWPDHFVSEATLTQRMMAVRKTLGDSGRAQRYIKTMHGRGYRFIAIVEERSEAQAPARRDDACARACPSCQQINGSEARFCSACGAPLSRLCHACGWEHTLEAQFCNACGASLETATDASIKTSPNLQDARHAEQTDLFPGDPWLAEGERRQLTVAFCDVVDSTALAQRHDPEDWRDILRTYHQHSASVMQRYEGHMAQYLSDGLLVYFGFPQAHEDDAGRAVRASLELLNTWAAVNAELSRTYGADVAIRIGIHTGLVVVSEMGFPERREHLALGETPNLAFRHQELAAPNSVVISEATHRLIAGYFICEDLGLQALKGYSQPQQAHQVLGVRPDQNRVDVAALSELTPLVGREQEFGILQARWEQAQEGLGQVVALMGETGIGKSRLVRSLKDQVAEEAHPQLEGRCSPYQQHTALYPIAEWLQGICQWRDADPPETKQTKLEQVLHRAHLDVESSVPLLAAFAPLPFAIDAYPPLSMEPGQQKQRFFAMMAELLRAAATERPLLVIIEDLHWADPSTLDLLGILIAQTPTLPMLLVMTCRSEFQLPWAMRSYITHLTLTRLSREPMTAIVMYLTGGKPVPDDLLDHLMNRTDGVPLFIEELTKTVLESGALVETDDGYRLSRPVSALAIPTTLHDALMARLDRLGAAKEIAQLGAVIGRQFSYDVLQAVSSWDEASLQQRLTELVEAELLYQQGLPPQSTYQFKHALIQDTAYQSLLRRTRRQLHQRLVEVIEARFPDITETQPEVLAHHATEAGLREAAVQYWQQAGQQAKLRSASVEAIAHLNKGLEMIELLPETPIRLDQKLSLHIALGSALQATKGIAAPEVGQVFTRARELCQQVGDTPQLFPVLLGLWWYYQTHPQIAPELVEELPNVAQRWNEPTLLLQAHHASWTTAYFHGHWTAVQHHAEQGLPLYASQDHHTYVTDSYHDPAACCLSMSSHALWVLGYPDQALARSREALRLAQKLSHAYSSGLALLYAAELFLLCGDVQTGQDLANKALTLSTTHDFRHLRPWATLIQDKTLVMQGQFNAGLTPQRQDVIDAPGASAWRNEMPAMLAEIYCAMGQADAGLAVIAAALSKANASGHHFWDAELLRIQGELLRRSTGNHIAEAEVCLDQALGIARRQQAKSLELRAAISLARLRQSQGKHNEAHYLLAPIYDWFTEGFDMADLLEARQLLDELRTAKTP